MLTSEGDDVFAELTPQTISHRSQAAPSTIESQQEPVMGNDAFDPFAPAPLTASAPVHQDPENLFISNSVADDKLAQMLPTSGNTFADGNATAAAPSTGGGLHTASSATTASTQPSPPPSSTSPIRVNFDGHARVTEGLRNVTYFCFRVTKTNNPRPTNITVPDITSTIPPHLRSINYGLSPLSWENQREEVVIQRRYSEMCALRELLLYQFPNIIIPPLRVKNTSENLESYLNKEETTKELVVQMIFFVHELLCIPSIMYLSELTKRFFTDEQQHFAHITYPEIQDKIKWFRRENQKVEEFSGRQREFSSAAAASAIASASTKAIKSVFSFFGAGTRETSPGVGNSSQAPPPREPEVSKDVDEWNAISSALAVRRQHLKAAAASFNKYLAAEKKVADSEAGMAAAAQGYAGELRAHIFDGSTLNVTTITTVGSGAEEVEVRLPPLSDAMDAFGSTMVETTDIERAKRRNQFSDVSSRLRCESDYAKAILFRVDDILSLYAYIEGSQKYQYKSAAWEEAMQCAKNISRSLRKDYEEVYTPSYHKRIADARSRVFGPMKSAAEALQQYRRTGALGAYLEKLPSALKQEVSKAESTCE